MNFRAPLAVGVVLLMGVGGLIFLVMNTTKDQFDESSTYPLHADFQDASGIRPKTRVQINGIDVGKIVGIEHVRGSDGRLLARISLRVHKRYVVYNNAVLHKAAESLLGDFRLDLDPGTPDQKPLQPDEGIADARSQSEIDEIKNQLLQVSKHVNEVTDSLAKVLASPEGEGSLKSILAKVESSVDAIEGTTQALRRTIVGNDQVLGTIIQNVGKISDSLALLSQPGGDVPTTARNIATLSAKLDKMADTIQGLIAGPEASASGEAQQAGSVRSTMDNLNESITRLNDVIRKVDEGQGTLGRVINDPGIADRVENTLDSANEIIGSIASVETQIELRSEYAIPFYANEQVTPSIKNTLGLTIRPKPDKAYILEAIADPRGRQARVITSTQIGGGTVVTDETTTSFNDLKFSAEFAKRYYFLTLRFGIIENTGGLGINLHGLRDKLEVRLDAFDFSRRDPRLVRPIFPRLRATGMVELVQHVSVQGGIDDPFNQDLRTWFLGGVLRFSDDDLKAFLTLAPKP